MTDMFLAHDLAFLRSRSDFHDRCRFHFGPRHPLVIPPVVQDDMAEDRRKFYRMVERHLSREEPKPTTAKKGHKPKAESAPVVIDGRPVEIERYGDGRRDIRRNNAADAMQWLIMKGRLNSMIEEPRTDKKLELAWAEGRGRITTATRLAEIFEKAELTPLRSPDFEATPGGSFGPRHIGVSKFRCIEIVAQLEGDIPPACMVLLRAIICRNEFPWLGLKPKNEQRVMESIRLSLDFAAWSLDRHHPRAEMTEEEVVRRWPAAREWFVAKRLAGDKKTIAFRMDQAPEHERK